MKKFAKILLGIVALLLAGLLVIAFMPGTASSEEGNPVANIKAVCTNAVINMSGAKGTAVDTLLSNLGTISDLTGLSQADCAQIIYGLDIESWEVSTLPSAAEASGSISGEYAGIDGTITYYDDPSYITVNAYGQNITMKVSSSAENYLPYLQSLS